MYDEFVPTLLKFLANLDSWLAEAADVAAEREVEVDDWLDSCLAPDMFPLRRQVQSACDAAKFIGARLADVQAPSHEDGAATLADLRSRIADVRAFLEGLDRAAVDQGADRVLQVGFLPEGMGMTGASYARGFGLPNFFFHLSMAYALLRHNGVPLGKRAYIGALDLTPLG